ncbi:PQQ-dependent sugar dehydrogenase [Sulfidibacter corallicola]|uniref:PQQ-dependent sugar dehydrogenase n=1 Tax=Sulfidibacter corallicola TaxID=2818388 RepID=A0A8A4TUC3_SULCO|nr:PQQ-dependent sugar dehydrogenase [Sulfidibacter corallicola]QTD52734.1 PQQ-dependent sugar dehydrogenase [Sulfidibacter corallicola]
MYGSLSISRFPHSIIMSGGLWATALCGLLFFFGAAARAGEPLELELEQVATLSNVVHIANAGDDRLFLVRRSGTIRILAGDTVLETPFLDIPVGSGGERGLLSAAFHPNYAQNGYFFVYYSNLAGDSVIARFQVSGDPNVADETSEAILLTIDQPANNHNGGIIKFGPDGYLYIGLGDGGNQNDPDCVAQNLGSPLGKVLRIDVDDNPDNPPFHGIPASNPFVGVDGAREEIWALGLRNPWRFSFDRQTGDFYIADVGQNSLEEVNFQPAASTGGENYGWDRMEGTNCFEEDPDCPGDAPLCNDAALTLPVAEYSHTIGCSVTGGYVYRGSLAPGLVGRYLYTDWCSGRVWAANRVGENWVVEELTATTDLPNLNRPTTFGEDADGELYVQSGSDIFRFRETCPPSLVFLLTNWNQNPDGNCLGETISVLSFIQFYNAQP